VEAAADLILTLQKMPVARLQRAGRPQPLHNLEALRLIIEANRSLAAKDRSPNAKREPITVSV
jgi:hypothetical protein